MSLSWPQGRVVRGRLVLAVAPAHAADKASAVLKDASGKEVGTADAHRHAERRADRASTLTGVPPGEHAFHVHAVGKCDPPDFKSAGPHFNPDQTKHGLMNARKARMPATCPICTCRDDGKLEVEVLEPDR